MDVPLLSFLLYESEDKDSRGLYCPKCFIFVLDTAATGRRRRLRRSAPRGVQTRARGYQVRRAWCRCAARVQGVLQARDTGGCRRRRSRSSDCSTSVPGTWCRATQCLPELLPTHACLYTRSLKSSYVLFALLYFYAFNFSKLIDFLCP